MDGANEGAGMARAEQLRKAPAPVGHPPLILHPFRGVMLVAAAVLLFACMDTTTKYLTADFAPPIVIAVRYTVQCLLMVLLLTPSHGRRLVQTRRTGLVLLRAACLALASLVMAVAFNRLPIAEATAIVFLSPLLVVLLSGFTLGERVGGIGIAAAVGGFVGVVLIARPGSGLDSLGVLCALCGAALIATYQLLSRVLARTEGTVAMLFYTALLGMAIYGLVFPWFWEGRMPSLLQAALLVSTGITGGVGHFLFTAAHRSAPASLLAPVMYVQLMWASLLGWLVFNHVPAQISIVGMCVVAVSGAAVALHSRSTRIAPAVVTTPADPS